MLLKMRKLNLVLLQENNLVAMKTPIIWFCNRFRWKGLRIILILNCNLRQARRYQRSPSLQELLVLQQHPSRQGDQRVQSHHGFLWVPLCQMVQRVQEVRSCPMGKNKKLLQTIEDGGPCTRTVPITLEEDLQRGQEVRLCQQHQGSQ